MLVLCLVILIFINDSQNIQFFVPTNECYENTGVSNPYSISRSDVTAEVYPSPSDDATPEYPVMFCKQGYYMRGLTIYWDTTTTGLCYDQAGIVWLRPLCASLYNRNDIYECPIFAGNNLGGWRNERVLCKDGDFMVKLKHRNEDCRQEGLCPCDHAGTINIDFYCRNANGTTYLAGAPVYTLYSDDPWRNGTECAIGSYMCGIQLSGDLASAQPADFRGIWRIKYGCCRWPLFTYFPTNLPTILPTLQPIITNTPTHLTKNPTLIPSHIPSFLTNIPTKTILPSVIPSISPTYLMYTYYPTNIPTILPSNIPTYITQFPSIIPTIFPTKLPTIFPSKLPTNYPTIIPTLQPITINPTNQPTLTPKQTIITTNNNQQASIDSQN